MSTPLLQIENLQVSVAGTLVLKGVSLEVQAGEVHAASCQFIAPTLELPPL